jgi:hypothetical protein
MDAVRTPDDPAHAHRFETGPGSRGQPHTTIRGGGQCLQEELGRVVNDIVQRYP